MPKRTIQGAKMVYKGVKTMTAVAATAGKALQIASRVAGLVNAEKKTYDVVTFINGTAGFNSTGTVFCISAMSAGVAYNERNGNSIKPKSIQWKYNMFVGTANTTYRIIVFQDKEPKQANPSITDVLEISSTLSPLNHVNGTRFKILKDYLGELDTVKSPVKTISTFIPLTGHIKYINSTSGVANTDEGNIFVLLLADAASGTTAPQTAQYYRLRFYDN